MTKRLDRPDARITLAERAGVAPVVAGTAIEPAARAVIAALARGADQEGGADAVAELVSAVGPVEPTKLVDRLGSTSSLGADLVKTLFGDDLEAVAVGIGGKKTNDPEIGTTLLTQVTPVVIGLVAERQADDDLDPKGLAALLTDEAAAKASSDSGSPHALSAPSTATLSAAATAMAAALVDGSGPGSAGDDGAEDGGTSAEAVGESVDAETAGADSDADDSDDSDDYDTAKTTDDADANDSTGDADATTSADGEATGEAADADADGVAVAGSEAGDAPEADAAAAASGAASDDEHDADDEDDTDELPAQQGDGEPEPSTTDQKADGDDEDEPDDSVLAPGPLVIDQDPGRTRNPLLALVAVLGLTLAAAWLITQVSSDSGEVATSDRTSTSAQAGAAEDVAGPEADEAADDADAGVDDDPDGRADGIADDGEEANASSPGDADDGTDRDADGDDADEPQGLTETGDDNGEDGPEVAAPVDDAELAGRVADAVQATGVGGDVAVTVVGGRVTLGGETSDAEARRSVEGAAAGVDGVVGVTSAIRLSDADPAADDTTDGTTDGTTDDDPADAESSGSSTINDELGLDNIRFDYYSAEVSAAGRAELDRVVAFLEANDGISLEIQGHTDAIGPASLNQRLGQRRAEAVRAYLVEAGIDGSRLVAVGVGEGEPVASNNTESGREANRRIEFVIR